jgi:hypothetical protein
MVDTVRVKPGYVWNKLKSGADTLLVCAYEDEEKHRQFDLEGSIGLAAFRTELPSIGKEREVVFYCS